ncbi:GAF domain-containing protein, partial [candidate division WOR-3 bacterium]|nr:GAF domain-containing protein [candidate division WOR-3 bacterium]
MINGSAFALSILIAGSIVGSGATDNWPRLFLFFPLHYVLQNGIFFYLPEFISRKSKREEIFYIHSWEVFFYILTAVTAVGAYFVIAEPTLPKILLSAVGFLLLRWFIRRISFDAIEGNIYKDLIKLQSKVMKRSLEETIKVVVSYSNQYVDWTALNLFRINHEKEELHLIYTTNEENEVVNTIPLSEGITGRCAREGTPIIIRDTSAAEDYVALRNDVKSEMTLPLVSEGRVIGVLDIEHNLVGAFTEKEIEYAKFFAFQLSSALQTNISLQPLVSTSEELKGFTDETYASTNKIREEMGLILRKMQDILRGGGEQAKSLQDTEKALEELLSSHENIKALREEMSENMDAFGRIVSTSKESVEENLRLLSEIAGAIGEVEERVTTLRTISGGVMDISRSSKEIAEDTSLLALNASIEAVRAKGASTAFGVIAEEINELAKTASSNSDEISGSVKTIINEVKELTDKTDRVVDATKNIETASSSIMEQFDRINLQLSSLQEGLNQTIEVSKREIGDIEALGARIKQSIGVGEENINYIRDIDRLVKRQNQIIKDLNDRA